MWTPAGAGGCRQPENGHGSLSRRLPAELLAGVQQDNSNPDLLLPLDAHAAIIAFDCIDKDKSGSIDACEIADTLVAGGVSLGDGRLTASKLESMLAAHAVTGNALDMMAFMKLCSNAQRARAVTLAQALQTLQAPLQDRSAFQTDSLVRCAF